MRHLRASGKFLDDNLASRNWLAEDAFELEFWMNVIARFIPRFIPKSKKHILEEVINLRNVAVHRGIPQDPDGPHGLEFTQLLDATSLPTVLGDSVGKAAINEVLDYFMEEPTLSEESKINIKQAAYGSQPAATIYQVLENIQTMLEKSCFDYAARIEPQGLANKGWDMFEKVELGKWESFFHTYHREYDQTVTEIFPDLADDELRFQISGARIHIRNVVAHRKPLLQGDKHLVQQIHRGIKICVLVGDWDQAIEVEILGEMYFEKTSREQVIKRLKDVYRNGPIDTPYERQRRITLDRIVASVEGTDVDRGEAVVTRDTCDSGVSNSSIPGWAKETFSDSMHPTLKRKDSLELELECQRSSE